MTQKLRKRDNRRFARVITASKSDSLQSVESLNLTWETGERLKIFDISYGGIACQKPTKQNVTSGDLKTLQIHFARQQDIIFPAEVVWVGEEFVGLNFEPLNVQARKALNDFLDTRLLGVGLRLIDKKYYSEGLTCQRWFQGTHGVNVYIWEEEDKIKACEVEVEEYTVEFNLSKSATGKLVVTQDEVSLSPAVAESRVVVAKKILEQLAAQDGKVKQFLNQHSLPN